MMCQPEEQASCQGHILCVCVCKCVHMYIPAKLAEKSLRERNQKEVRAWGDKRLWIPKDQVEAEDEELLPCGALYDLSKEPLGLLPLPG